MEKEEKIVDKLLPIRVDNTITIYHVKYKEKDIIKVYQDFYVKPGSHIAHEMLHTKFHDQSDILKG